MANLLLNAAPRTPPAALAYGHPATGDTPSQPVALPTEDNIKAPEVDRQILSELQGNLFLVETDAFIRNFMYERADDPNAVYEGPVISLSSSERRTRDEKLAKECLEALKGRNESQAFKEVVKTINIATDEKRPVTDIVATISPYLSNKFIKLTQDINSEWDLYNPLADLFSFIGHFFRYYFNPGTAGKWTHDIDNDWPCATNPRKPSETPSTFLRRRFVVTRNKTFDFSDHVQERPALQPNLSLILCEKPQGAWSEPKNPPHWKDVKVPIEVKLSDGFDADRVCQMARYARAIRLEQFDRNFTFSLLISKSKCRVFHWDASRCHVSEVDIHDNPAVFIQIIGRLASMDPQSMGYDPRFSNSGRILSTDNPAMPTWLEVIPAQPTKFQEPSSRAWNEGKEPLVLELLIERPIYQARGFLFSRFTRVREGREVVGADSQDGELRVLKQNWADADRVNEALLYEEVKDVPNAARLTSYENISRTIDIHSLWNDGGILGIYRKDGARQQPLPQLDMTQDEMAFHLYPCEESPRAFSRVLVRMVIQQKGRPILTVQSSRELVEATKQWVIGIRGVNGITHRDVSNGSLLLDHDSGPPAFNINLGLADRSASPGRKEDFLTPGTDPKRVAKAHHLTGTLPFIANDLLVAMMDGKSFKHEVYLDVESVFWVVLYVVLREEQSEFVKAAMRNLLSTDVGLVELAQHALRLLSGALDQNGRRPLKLTSRFSTIFG
ncbi:hypothetical protein FRC04_010557 [Tulasnella sp. 424]|nr:hypothetical protein FRC04_010557 [Tulasnella sp. 424]KAG8972296.1 hypothetical protein FRC05_010138 [Tulasnella sp. 425]